MSARVITAFVLASAAAGCGHSKQSHGQLEVAANATSVTVMQGGSATLGVDIVRTGFGGNVSVTLHDLPPGVTVASATIPSGATSATLTITADAASPQIDTIVMVTASAGTVTRSSTVGLRVRGPAGSIDTTLEGGLLLADFTHENDRINDLRILSDGRILAAGTVFNGGGIYIGLARWFPDGTPDPSMGGGVGRAMNFTFQARGNALALRSDGRIVVAGGTGGQFLVARYLDDGALDTSFGAGNGRVVTAFTSFSEASAVLLDTADRIVAAGFGGNGVQDFVLARWLPSGTPDITLNTTGTVNTDIGGLEDGANAVLASSGRIVLAGSSNVAGTQFDLSLARYNATNGSLDTSFGTLGTGKVTTPWTNQLDTIRDAIRQPDGKIVVVGESNQDLLVARYLNTGVLDTSFGAGTGVVTMDFLAGRDYGSAVALQSDGRIVVAGRSTQGATNADFALVRLEADGTIDTSFGGGKFSVDFGQGDDEAFAIAIDADGRILAGGRATIGGSEDFALVRFWP